MHAIDGMVTEVGELQDTLKKWLYYGKPLDRVNIIEELGDLSWYWRLACASQDAAAVSVILQNVRKLQKRYPERFTELAAINRDLPGERSILEQPL